METTLPSKKEALYRTMHNTMPSYRDNNWGILLLKYWASFIPARPTDILEIGCGNGKTCRFLTDMGHDVTGVDIVSGPYDREGYNFVMHDVTKSQLPFGDKEFDLAVSFDVLEHLEPEFVSDVLWDIFRVAKKVVIVVPLLHETEGKPLLGKLHRTVKPAEWWIEKLNNLSFKLANKYITISPDSRNGTNRLIFCGESV
jgi:SAM-dependent methyltransferase